MRFFQTCICASIIFNFRDFLNSHSLNSCLSCQCRQFDSTWNLRFNLQGANVKTLNKNSSILKQIPGLRKTVNSCMKFHFTDLNKKHRLTCQVGSNYLKKDGKCFLEYGSLEQNQRLRNKKDLWTYKVENHLQLSRLYMKASLSLFFLHLDFVLNVKLEKAEQIN